MKVFIRRAILGSGVIAIVIAAVVLIRPFGQSGTAVIASNNNLPSNLDLDHQLQDVLNKRDYLWSHHQEYVIQGTADGVDGWEVWKTEDRRLKLEIGKLYEQRNDFIRATDYYGQVNSGPGFELNIVPRSKFIQLYQAIEANPELGHPTNRNRIVDHFYEHRHKVEPSVLLQQPEVATATTKADSAPTASTAPSPEPAVPTGPPPTKVQLDSYMQDVQHRIKRSWFPPKGKEAKRIGVWFRVHRDGSMSDLRIDQSCGDKTADDAALKAVRIASPFRPLPTGSGENQEIQFSFDK